MDHVQFEASETRDEMRRSLAGPGGPGHVSSKPGTGVGDPPWWWATSVSRGGAQDSVTLHDPLWGPEESPLAAKPVRRGNNVTV